MIRTLEAIVTFEIDDLDGSQEEWKVNQDVLVQLKDAVQAMSMGTVVRVIHEDPCVYVTGEPQVRKVVPKPAK